MAVADVEKQSSALHRIPFCAFRKSDTYFYFQSPKKLALWEEESDHELLVFVQSLPFCGILVSISGLYLCASSDRIAV